MVGYCLLEKSGDNGFIIKYTGNVLKQGKAGKSQVSKGDSS